MVGLKSKISKEVSERVDVFVDRVRCKIGAAIVWAIDAPLTELHRKIETEEVARKYEDARVETAVSALRNRINDVKGGLESLFHQNKKRLREIENMVALVEAADVPPHKRGEGFIIIACRVKGKERVHLMEFNPGTDLKEYEDKIRFIRENFGYPDISHLDGPIGFDHLVKEKYGSKHKRGR